MRTAVVLIGGLVLGLAIGFSSLRGELRSLRGVLTKLAADRNTTKPPADPTRALSAIRFDIQELRQSVSELTEQVSTHSHITTSTSRSESGVTNDSLYSEGTVGFFKSQQIPQSVMAHLPKADFYHFRDDGKVSFASFQSNDSELIESNSEEFHEQLSVVMDLRLARLSLKDQFVDQRINAGDYSEHDTQSSAQERARALKGEGIPSYVKKLNNTFAVTDLSILLTKGSEYDELTKDIERLEYSLRRDFKLAALNLMTPRP